jgi:hypothetical protein
MKNNNSNRSNNYNLAIIAIVAVLAVLGVVVVTVTVIIPMQQAEARGCPLGTPAPNASRGKCFRG